MHSPACSPVPARGCKWLVRSQAGKALIEKVSRPWVPTASLTATWFFKVHLSVGSGEAADRLLVGTLVPARKGQVWVEPEGQRSGSDGRVRWSAE